MHCIINRIDVILLLENNYFQVFLYVSSIFCLRSFSVTIFSDEEQQLECKVFKIYCPICHFKEFLAWSSKFQLFCCHKNLSSDLFCYFYKKHYLLQISDPFSGGFTVFVPQLRSIVWQEKFKLTNKIINKITERLGFDEIN